jgi:hypothetical protein
MDKETTTFVVAGIGVGGALGGIFIGHLLTRSSQKKQYRIDHIKTESQELLTALMTVYPSYTAWARDRYAVRNLATLGLSQAARQQEYEKVTVDFHKVLNDRVFIAEDIERRKIKTQWDLARSEYEAHFNEDLMKQRVDAIRADILHIATKYDSFLLIRAWRKMFGPKLSI